MNLENPILTIQLFETPKTSNDLFEVISADAVLVRADCIENDDEIRRISLANGVKIYSLKSELNGGNFKDDLEKRHALLIQALSDYELIELEEQTDLTRDILGMIPADRRLITWNGKARSFEDLEATFLRLMELEARYYQCINAPQNISECLWSLQLLKKYPANGLISFAGGAVGIWTQILSVYLGSPMIYGKLNRNKLDEHFLLHEQLKEDYNLSSNRNINQIFGIAGNPVFSSMSPQIHNHCYQILGMEALYLPFHIERFEDFWKFISIDFPNSGLEYSLGGFTMVSPFKEDSYNIAKGHLCSATLRSQACNILINKNGEWHSDSSDGLGVLTALEAESIDLKELKIAIIGCGGAGRTIASRLKSEGADIIFYNRSEDRGRFASRLLDIPYKLIAEFDASMYDVVINATPVGKHGKNLIFDPTGLKPNSLAIDMAYAKEDTLLVSGCQNNGKRIIQGKQILLHQVKKQFLGLTGKEMPLEVENMVRRKTENLLKVE